MTTRAPVKFETTISRWPTTAGFERRSIVIAPARPLQPFSLLVWGATGGARLDSLLVDGREQLMSPVPLGVFEAECTPDEFDELLEPRPDGHDALHTAFIGSYFDIALPRVLPPGALELVVSGEYHRGVVLGTMPRLTEAA